MPRNYQNTIIYKIVCKDLNINDVYVGHTTDFKTRKSHHKGNCNNERCPRYNLKVHQSLREKGGWDNWDMIEVEKYPCNDGNEARMRERYWYEQLNANLNMDLPNGMSKEDRKEYNKKRRQTEKQKEYIKTYNEQHKEAQKEYLRIWHQQNKEKRQLQSKERKQEKFNCDCGGFYSRGDKSRHLKTKLHCQFIENQNKSTA